MIRNASGQVASAEVINATTGAAFTGAVTCFVTIDGGTQTVGSVGAGASTNEGNGLYTYNPTATETNGASISFTFVGSGAIPATTTYDTLTLAQATAIAAISTPASVTVNALLTSALSRLLQDEGPPSADYILTALLRLNDLIDAWKIEGLTVYTFPRTVWTLTAATTYTVGATGTIAIDRPSNASLLRFGLVDTSVSPTFERPMANFTEDGYRAIPSKSLTSTYPVGFYYNPTTPFGTLSPFPVPTSSTLQGVVYAPSPANEVGINDTLSLPQGYRRFYRDNLAVELGTDFDVQPSQLLIQSATDSKAMVKKANVRMVELVSEAAVLNGSNRLGGIAAFYAGP